MKRLLLVGAVAWWGGASALAADMPIVTKAPMPAPVFSWTGCYLGGHAGGGWGHKQVTDPIQVVQDSLSPTPVTVGITTLDVSPSGLVVGGQFGCDYQFSPAWVAGLELAASGSTMKGSTSIALPQGLPGELESVTARTDFLYGATARLGFALDRWLVYARGGVALAGDKYSFTGTFTGIPFDFEGLDQRIGWVVGGGFEWAFAGHWSADLEYDFYDFGHRSVLMSDAVNLVSGPVDFRQTVQVVKLGVNFRMWGLQ
jgi:opacity protein-like surface antigen